MARHIDYIVLHCTAGPAQQKTTDIFTYWKHVLGWKSYGYHWLISADGSKARLTDDEKPSNGVKNYNHNSIHICYKGGTGGKDTRTIDQMETIEELLRDYRKKYPAAKIVGHRDLSPDLNHDGKITPNEWIKMCPCFDVQANYGNI